MASPNGPTVLVAEDDDDYRALTRAKLEAHGYAVGEARNGREALAQLLDPLVPEPHVILLDMEMPLLTGWELLRILASYWRLARIPVIVLSGSQRDDRGSHAREWLEKPQEWSRLLQVVRSHAPLPIDE
jgi:CheY-like chemotaxis protein